MKAFVMAAVFAAAVGMAGTSFGQTGPVAGKNAPGLAGSQANLATAKEKVSADKSKLDTMVSAKQSAFETSTAYTNAQQAMADAVAADKAAKDAVLAKLQTQAAYKDAKAKADAADAAAKGGGADAAKRALDADGAVSKMEQAAYAGDDGVKTADANLATAKAALQKLKTDFATSLKTDVALTKQRDLLAKDEESANAWSERVDQLESKPKSKK